MKEVMAHEERGMQSKGEMGIYTIQGDGMEGGDE